MVHECASRQPVCRELYKALPKVSSRFAGGAVAVVASGMGAGSKASNSSFRPMPVSGAA